MERKIIVKRPGLDPMEVNVRIWNDTESRGFHHKFASVEIFTYWVIKLCSMKMEAIEPQLQKDLKDWSTT
ncbi:hypothetical protein ANCDUO_25420, partial [Ancylostoma duodenale]